MDKDSYHRSCGWQTGTVQPDVSIIMPVCNEARYLRQCLDSVLSQTCSRWEMIVCDDGSSDGTAAILREYRRFDARIRIIANRETRGLSESLNRCLKLCRGRFIARMDGDDVCVPERFRKQILFLQNHPEYDFVGCGLLLFDNRGVWGMRAYPPCPGKWDFAYNSPFAHPALMIRSAVLRKAGGYDTMKFLERSQDYWLFMRLYAAGSTGANLSEPLLYYREDRVYNAKRKYRFRLQEAVTRFYGFHQLDILPAALPFVFKPFLAGLIPEPVLSRLRGDIRIEKKEGAASCRRNGTAGSRNRRDEPVPAYRQEPV